MGQAKDSLKIEYYRYMIGVLASDEMMGREAGSPQEGEASELISKEFKQIGLSAEIHEFQFDFNGDVYNSKNVIGRLNNDQDSTILITAHYDHLGMGGTLSNSTGIKEVHNGADDNASGVALLLSLARQFSSTSDLNLLIVAYSGHEFGLHGSREFAKAYEQNLDSVFLSVNFDMVGRLKDDYILYCSCTSDLNEELQNVNINGVSILKDQKDRSTGLDTKWTVQRGIPSVSFSTGIHSDYHKVTDDIEYIDLDGMLKIEEVIYDWITSRTKDH